jgi:hypothetical protein
MQQYLGQSLVALGSETAQFLGWIGSEHLPSSASQSGRRAKAAEPTDQNGIVCHDIDILAVSRGRTWWVMHVSGADKFYGAFSSVGDYRVNLGQGDFSADAPDADVGPLAPFIAKEQLSHCTDSASGTWSPKPRPTQALH